MSSLSASSSPFVAQSRQTRQWNQAWAALSTKWRVANHIEMYKALIDGHFQQMLIRSSLSINFEDVDLKAVDNAGAEEAYSHSISVQGVTGSNIHT